MLDHYIVDADLNTGPGLHLLTACGQTVPALPVPPKGSEQCLTCLSLAEEESWPN